MTLMPDESLETIVISLHLQLDSMFSLFINFALPQLISAVWHLV